jgi:hypothetical protein
MAGADFAPGTVALVTPDGSARQVAGDVAFPNGMAVMPDNSTLIVAESYGRKLTAFDIAADGGLSNRRLWAGLGDGVPDGICIDAENAVWYADVPNQRCVRVREGGEVLATINLDRGCFACMLGGADGRTLLLVATEWRGPAGMTDGRRTSQVLTVPAPARGRAGHRGASTQRIGGGLLSSPAPSFRRVCAQPGLRSPAGKFSERDKLAVNPRPESGFECWKKTDTASATASKPAPEAADGAVSAALAAPCGIMVNEEARRFWGPPAADRSLLWTRKRSSFAASGSSGMCQNRTFARS